MSANHRSINHLFWNPEETRLRAPWRLLAFVVLVAFLMILSGALVSVVTTGSSPPFLGQLQFNLVIIVAVWLATRFIDWRPYSDTGIRWTRNWWIDLGFGVALGAVLMTLIFLVELGAGWIRIGETFRTAEPGQSFAAAIAVPLIFYISVAISEELMFRGYFLLNLAEGLAGRIFSPRRAVAAAWTITSILFGIAHAFRPEATLVSTCNIVFAGLLLGLAYVMTGSLAIPIGVHFSWNFFQGNVFGFPVSGTSFLPATFIAVESTGPAAWTGGPFGPEGGLTGLLAFLLGIALVTVWVRTRYRTRTLLASLASPSTDPQSF